MMLTVLWMLDVAHATCLAEGQWELPNGSWETAAGVGDLNGDGADDLLVSDFYLFGGLSWLFPGGPDGPSTTPAWTNEGPPGSWSGITVSGAGDVNGDGYGDVYIGSAYDTVWIFAGGPAGPGSMPLWTGYGFFPGGYYPTSGFGRYVTHGDLDGDGYSDVIAANDTDMVFAYYGGPDGPSLGWVLDEPSGGFGRAMAAADLDGDGADELIIGAPNYAGTGWAHGAVHVIPGSAARTHVESWLQESNTDFAAFGWSVAAADVNDDGWADVLISQHAPEQASLYLGSAAGLATTPAWSTIGTEQLRVQVVGDVDADGLPDMLIGSTVYRGDAEALLVPWATMDGYVMQGAGGDFDGDGRADVLMNSNKLTVSFSKCDTSFYLDKDGDGLGEDDGCLLRCTSPGPDYVLVGGDDCPFDPDNDADADGVCGDMDPCDGGPDNCCPAAPDPDADGVPDDCDPCPLDPDDDADADGLCGDVDDCDLGPNLDTDADGTFDACDLCPLDPLDDLDADGLCGELDACDRGPNVDTDGDGTFDACDACPLDPTHADAVEPVDRDADGIPDVCDPCDLGPNVDADGDGAFDACDPCPDGADADGDTVCDPDDACPGDDDRLDADADGLPNACDPCPQGACPEPDDTDDTDAPDDAKPDDPGGCDTTHGRWGWALLGALAVRRRRAR